MSLGSINGANLLLKSEYAAFREESERLSILTNTHHPMKGLSLIIIGTLVFAGANTFAKKMTQDIPTMQLSLIRWLVMMVWTGLFIVLKGCCGEDLAFFGPKKERLSLIMRSVVFFFSVIIYYWALIYVPIGFATSISRTFPLITAVLSSFGCCGKVERLSKVGWFFSLIGFSGAFLMVSFVKVDNGSIGILLSVLTAFLWALEVILIRNTGSGVHWLQIEFMTAFLCSLFLAPLSLFIQYATLRYIMNNSVDNIFDFYIKPFTLGQCVLLGTCYVIGYGFYTRGFQLEEAPKGTIMIYLQIPVVYILQYIMFHQGASVVEITGACLMVFGTAGTVVEKMSNTRTKEQLNNVSG